MSLLAKVDVDAMAQPTRAKVYLLVANQPGITFRELARRLGTGYGATQWHLYVLERLGHVHHVKAGGRVHYYPVGAVSRPEAVADAASSEPTRRRLLERIRETPGIRFEQLQAEFIGTRQNTMYHLRRLERAGLVRLSRHPGGPKRLATWPTPVPRSTNPAKACDERRQGARGIALAPSEARPPDRGSDQLEVPA